METLTVTDYNLSTERKSIFSIFKFKKSAKNYQIKQLHDLNFMLPKLKESIKSEYDSLYIEEFKNIKTPIYKWYGTGRNVLYVQGMSTTSTLWLNTANDLKQKGDNVFVIEAPIRIKNGNSYFNPQLYASYISQFVEKNNIELIITEKEGSYCTVLGLNQHIKTIKSVKKIILLSPVTSYLKLIKKYYKNNVSSIKTYSFLHKNLLKSVSNSNCRNYTLKYFKATLNKIEFIQVKSLDLF